MEYTPLTKASGRLTDSRSVAQMAADVCRMLLSLHQSNQLHGDVKPQTIFLDSQGRFFLAEPTSTPVAAFCPPEDPDTWGLDADTYALGRVMHWLLNGRQLAAEPLSAPQYADEALSAIILRACSYDPQYRYPDASAMLADLEHYFTPKKKAAGWIPALIIGIVAAALVSVIGIGIFMVAGDTPTTTEPTGSAPHTHAWKNATCLAPESCSCGEERGEPLGHDWIPGDCETPDTCGRCGATRGESSGHKWMEATFDYPEYCDYCGTTRGEALPMPFTWLPHLSDTNSPGSDKDVTIGDWDAPDGILHEHTIRFWLVDREGYHNSESTTYALDGQYTTFSCTGFLTDGTEPGGSAYIRVWGDGQILNQSMTITSGDIISYSVDVTGVKELTVECVTNSESFTYCVVDAHIQK